MSRWLVGIDSGGTFTDIIAHDADSGRVEVAKVPSVPQDPAVAIMNGLEELFGRGLRPDDVQFFAHGTTVATNGLLEGKGVRAGLLITRGFRAVYEARFGSQPENTQDLVDPFYQKPPLLVPQYLTQEISERLSYSGQVIEPIVEAQVRQAVRALKARQVESIAVCYLFSFLNPAHEELTDRIIREEIPGLRRSLSSRVLPTIREYPRLSTTVVDAYIGPVMQHYLEQLSARLRTRGISTPQVYLMQSNGGLMRMNVASQYPVQTLLSGPAGGVVAGLSLARAARQSHVVTFDMGGTSTDISVIIEGRAEETSEGRLAGQDLGIPMLRIRTLGAGGGTLARIGKDGLLKVGPESAGAAPGPACYGRGGSEPTVTDANLVLGILGSDSLLGGRMSLDLERARAAMVPVAAHLGLSVTDAAAGILRIVNNNMAISIRLALYQQGQDPRRFALIAFGGAGPIHAPMLAQSVNIPRVMVPQHPGLNSAMGLLQTDVRHTYLRSATGTLRGFPVERINEIFAALQRRAVAEAAEEGFSEERIRLIRQIDLRYPHQGYQLTVPCPYSPFTEADKLPLKQSFDELHQLIYGQNAAGEDAELVTFRMLSEASVPQLELARVAAGDGRGPARALKGSRSQFDLNQGRFVPAQVYDRDRLRAGDQLAGPAIIEQFDATTVLPPGQTLRVDEFGTLIIATGAAA